MMKGYFLAITLVISLNSISEELSNFSEERKIEYIKNQISLILPEGSNIVSIEKSEFPGIYKVFYGDIQPIYVSEQGTYFIYGNMFKINSKNSLSLTYEKNSLNFGEIIDYLNQNVNIGVEDVDNNSTTFSDVLAGTYSVFVTDANGCQKTIENIVLEQPEILEISSETVTDITCNGSDDGSIDIAVSGGTGNYTYSWSNNATTQDITDLSPGTYTVNITDQNGCLVSKEYTILEPDALSISADVSNFNGFEISCNGAKTLLRISCSNFK
mgnify:CR=1 FL=1